MFLSHKPIVLAFRSQQMMLIKILIPKGIQNYLKISNAIESKDHLILRFSFNTVFHIENLKFHHSLFISLFTTLAVHSLLLN